jgi:hypothetical protein
MLAGYAYLLPAIVCLGGTVLFRPQGHPHELYYNVLIRPQDYPSSASAITCGCSMTRHSGWPEELVRLGLFCQLSSCGFVVALLLHAAFKGRALPTVEPVARIIPGVVALVWNYQANYGPINDLPGIGPACAMPVAWLSDPTWPCRRSS